MKLVIFDVDGTIVDSQNYICEAGRRAFIAHDMAPPSREAMLSIVGLSLVTAFETLAPDGPCESMAQSYKDAWHDMRGDPRWDDPLFPGARETIEALAAREDVLLGIATGKSRKGVMQLFEKTGWERHFCTVQTADGNPSKPAPGMVLAAMAETGAAPHDTVMIGDSTYDILMARAAGVAAIGVAWGYHAPQALLDAGAREIAQDYAALAALLDAAPAGAR
ncbi:MAG: family hydrolase [Hyphomicrobiales bacterium]|jgi:phosphoglycolate phosphatase|nr:family hydrolase [Hyphomicrobiales bacterium]